MYNISELHTKSLLDFNPLIKNRCYGMVLSCVTGLSANNSTPTFSLTLSDWKNIATDAKLGRFIWGNYQQNGEEIIVSLNLYSGQGWKAKGKVTIKTPLDLLLQESSKQILTFLNKQGVSVKLEERARILSTKSEPLGAWKQNAMGYWCQQTTVAASEEQKRTIAKKCDASFMKAVSIDPEYVDAWCNLGYQKVVTGDLKGAEKAFRTALKIKPDMVRANMGLGYYLAEKGELKNAISYLERGIRLNPSRTDYYDYLMSVYRNARLYQEGLIRQVCWNAFSWSITGKPSEWRRSGGRRCFCRS